MKKLFICITALLIVGCGTVSTLHTKKIGPQPHLGDPLVRFVEAYGEPETPYRFHGEEGSIISVDVDERDRVVKIVVSWPITWMEEDSGYYCNSFTPANTSKRELEQYAPIPGPNVAHHNSLAGKFKLVFHGQSCTLALGQ